MEFTHFEASYPPKARASVIAALLQYVKEGNSCQLVGLPGVGRANIFGMLAYNKEVREYHLGDEQKSFHFIPVDFSEVRGKPLLEATKLMFLELVESLLERDFQEEYEIVRNFFKDALVFQDELVLFQGFKKAIDYLANERKLNIVFLLERFDEYIPVLTKDFFGNLRTLRNRAKYRFSVVFSLGRPLEDLIDPFMLSDFYEFFIGHTVYVPLFDELLATFRLTYMEQLMKKTLSPKEKEFILTLTGGHGKLIRLCFEMALNAQEKLTNELFLKKQQVQGALLEIWYYLAPQEQQDIEDLIKNNTPIVSQFLEKVYLVKEGILTIPLLTDFLKASGQLQFQDAKIIFDETANIIKRGAVIISDMLTASEFRLLALFLQHEGEVIDKETMVNTVWQEVASTAGVTDQAVDQLIFRLRKKIEDEPTAPTHILTVKGRGVKFVQ